MATPYEDYVAQWKKNNPEPSVDVIETVADGGTYAEYKKDYEQKYGLNPEQEVPVLEEATDPVNPDEYEKGKVPISAGLINTIRGLGQAGIEATIDAPQALSSMVGPAFTWAGEKLYNNPDEFSVWDAASNLTNTNMLSQSLMLFGKELTETGQRTKPSEADGLKTPLDFISKEDPDIPKDSYWNAARTAALWGAAGPVNALKRTARVLPDIAMGAGAAAGSIADDALQQNGNNTYGAGEIIGGLGSLAATGRGKKRSIAVSGDTVEGVSSGPTVPLATGLTGAVNKKNESLAPLLDQYFRPPVMSKGKTPNQLDTVNEDLWAQSDQIETWPAINTEMGEEIPQAVLRALEFLDVNSTNTVGLSAVAAAAAQARAREANLAQVMDALSEGDQGTLADILRNQSTSNVEASLANNPNFKQSADALNVQQENQVAEQVRNQSQGPGLPQAARDSAQRSNTAEVLDIELDASRRQQQNSTSKEAEFKDIEVLQASSEARATEAALEMDAARIAARDSEAQLETDLRPDEVSAATQQEIIEQRDAFQEIVVNPAFERFKESTPSISTTTIQNTINKFIAGMEGTQRNYFNDVFGSDINKLDTTSGTMTADAFIDYLSQLRNSKSNANRAASQPGGKVPAYSTLENMDELIAKIEQSVTSKNSLYQAAKDATSEKYRRFGDPKLTSALATYPELFGKKMGGLEGEAGVLSNRIIEETGIANTTGILFSQLTAAAKQEGIDSKFIRKYSDVINREGNLTEKQRLLFQDGATHADRLKEVESITTAKLKAEDEIGNRLARDEEKLTKAIKDKSVELKSEADGLINTVNAGLAGRYADQPEKLLRELTNVANGDPNIRALKALNEQMKGQGQGAAFRADVTSFAQEALLENDPEIRRILESSGILTKKELDNIERTANKLKSMPLRKAAIQHHWSVQKQGDSPLMDILKTGTVVAALKLNPGGNDLIVAGAMRRVVNKLMNGRPDDAAIAVLEEFFLNPQIYVNKIKLAEKTDSIDTAILTMFNAAINAERESQNN